jgi:hypothetical protein
LLVDGHQSRLKYAFLTYIHGEGHKWFVCLGVPYGTHLWQVADSSEMNGCFKMGLTKAKTEYVKSMKEGQGWSVTDVVPLVNYAFERSFRDTRKAKKAIAARGWNPLNYALLLHPDVASTKPKDPPMTATATTTGASSSSATTTSGVAGGDASTTVLTAVSTTTTGSNNAEKTSLAVTAVNVNGALSSSIIDSLLRHKARDAGRQEQAKKRQLDEAASNDTYKKLKDIGGCVTSGKLASIGCFELSEEVCQKVAAHHEGISQKQAEKESRKVVTNARREETKAAASAARQAKPRSQLSKAELNALSMSLRVGKKDSPLKPTKLDAAEQLKRRELREAKENERCGVPLTRINVIALIEELEEAGDTKEEELISKPMDDLTDELERRRLRIVVRSNATSNTAQI